MLEIFYHESSELSSDFTVTDVEDPDFRFEKPEKMKPGQNSNTSWESSREPNGELSYDLRISDGFEYDENSQRNSSDRSSNYNWEPIETSRKFVGDLREVKGETIFVDGSRYKGTWDALGMAGVGRYRMPHDVLYEGEMWDGMQHGQGRLEYPGKQKIDGVWSRGQLQKWKYTFSDGLIYEAENWAYCKFPDRRFNQSKLNGLNPAGRSLKTQHQPTKVIPAGCYDTGDGIFDPSTLCVTNFDRPSKIIRIPTADEIRWIMKYCRRGELEPTGYQPWLNENWSSQPPELPYRLPMSTDSPESWWKRIFTFERDTSVVLDTRRRSSKESEDAKTELGGSSDPAEYSIVCVSKSQGEFGPRAESDAENLIPVCGVLDVCGGDRDSEMAVFREVVCEPMSSGEYEDEDPDNLMMTVCVPPKGTYTITRRIRSASTLESLVSRSSDWMSDDGEGAGIYWEQDEDSLISDRGSAKDLSSYYSDISHYVEVKQSSEGEEVEDWRSYSDALRTSKDLGDLKSKSLRKKRKLAGSRRRTGNIKISKKVGPKKQLPKKRPCPDVTNADQLLQRKVGDLLFSPALEPPRSPVYLVKKVCDRKVCKKLKARICKKSTCGASASPANLPAKERKLRVCIGDKKSASSDKKKICSPSRPFIIVKERNNAQRSKVNYFDVI
ncbi:uncharacterized protein LOC124293454 [Neodiprion lecontei]|uniref:Uncharacterized protein LOC124293454 n=1 Tax=Neodiprion lecontei TaxID=441921 RepID=A0ABM3FQH7_NEOLC|nr:uncharacterized protein LOC124293454 [Neodiprion lecontei]